MTGSDSYGSQKMTANKSCGYGLGYNLYDTFCYRFGKNSDVVKILDSKVTEDFVL